jgi:hypothetical protein
MNWWHGSTERWLCKHEALSLNSSPTKKEKKKKKKTKALDYLSALLADKCCLAESSHGRERIVLFCFVLFHLILRTLISS